MDKEIRKEIERVYKLHQDLHGTANVNFGAVVKDVNLTYKVLDSVVFDVLREVR